jgi:hypothetical protein
MQELQTNLKSLQQVRTKWLMFLQFCPGERK